MGSKSKGDQAFQAWLESLDTCIKSRPGSPRIGQLDASELRRAFESGESPIIFAKRDPLPLALHPQARQRVAPRWHLLPWLIPILLIGVGVRLLDDIRKRKAVVQAIETRSGTIALPVTTDLGRIELGEAHEPINMIRDKITEIAKTPAKLRILEITPIKLIPPERFQYAAKAEAQNQFGAMVQYDLLIEAWGPFSFEDPRNRKQWLRTAGVWRMGAINVLGQDPNQSWRVNNMRSTKRIAPPKTRQRP